MKGIFEIKIESDVVAEKITKYSTCCLSTFPNLNYVSNSIYLLRDPNNFIESGVGYQFLPENQVYYQDIQRDFLNKQSVEDIYRYHEDELSLCTITQLDEKSELIDEGGGSIITDEIRLIIPKNALEKLTNIKVRRILLDCPSCNNNIKDGDEEDIDCGGSCWKKCNLCENNLQDQDETGIDCGGSCILELNREELPGFDENQDCITKDIEEYTITECQNNNECDYLNCRGNQKPQCSPEVNRCFCREDKQGFCGNGFCNFNEFLESSCPKDCSKTTNKGVIISRAITYWVSEGGIISPEVFRILENN